MNLRFRCSLVVLAASCLTPGCTQNSQPSTRGFEPLEVVDLGVVITEDLPERLWGREFMEANGYTRSNSFDVISWEGEVGGGRVSGSNSYYTLFNHGGPHVDAPNHFGVGGGLDSYPVTAFSGPLKVFDVTSYPSGRSVPADVFHGSVQPGDVVLIYTGYSPPPVAGTPFPETISLTPAAAEYLATLPVKAYGTDSFSVAAFLDATPIDADHETARAEPIHYAFLSRGIPIYEQLFNVSSLLQRPADESMHFVGVPLSIRDGDGMLVRPVVFIH